jgi:hypothetical protein
MFEIKVIDKIKTHFLFNNFFSENCAVYEIMLKNIVEPGMLQMAIWGRVACRISKATRAQGHASARAPTYTDTHTHRNTCCFSTATMVSWTRLIVTLYVQCLSCFLFLHAETGSGIHSTFDVMCVQCWCLFLQEVNQSVFEAVPSPVMLHRALCLLHFLLGAVEGRVSYCVTYLVTALT